MQQKKKLVKAPQKETTLIKIAGAIGTIAGKISNQKDHLIEAAGNAVESVKEAVSDLVSKSEPAADNVPKKVAKKAAKKLIKPAAKKSTKSVVVKKAPRLKKELQNL
ncbi:hypothetical protein QWZ08_07005 [Ferruginibacter paludis]|uniref:hypothetical protein n=1 Tax=Ferruginibacter paludis TaxID=1310417 RepID=UPI0025B3F309|nr:hypothetical protein [Ferruginibacter paludis]MDN3655365.1 hypothetical protein [Ferruginibacter paludis]